ncbi:MAG: ATP-binding cassette domain-containing protein, partial [Ruminococcus sp.]|nr:ATP-binding cassette domain-containing protein [Ruminococcus sp.]
MSELIRCSDISKSYGIKEALRSVNLTIESGKVIGLLGPNGSGKTT